MEFNWCPWDTCQRSEIRKSPWCCREWQRAPGFAESGPGSPPAEDFCLKKKCKQDQSISKTEPCRSHRERDMRVRKKMQTCVGYDEDGCHCTHGRSLELVLLLELLLHWSRSNLGTINIHAWKNSRSKKIRRPTEAVATRRGIAVKWQTLRPCSCR